jgi:hypothetical protein
MPINNKKKKKKTDSCGVKVTLLPKLWFCFDLFIMLEVANNHCG